MRKIAVMTDSNSGITQAEGKALGIFVTPMPFYINDELFYEDISLTQEEFYKRLEEDADIKTSQPGPEDVMKIWDELLEEYDEIVYLPMSSGLSGSCETAMMLAQDYDGKVQVVNNQRISVTLYRSVMEAKKMAEKGSSALEIKELLEATKFDSDIYITLDTLKYLKKGGRLTAAAAAIGTVLNLKPVLRIKGEKLDAFAKTRGWKASKKKMLTTIQALMDTEFQGAEVYIDAAYSGNREDAEAWKKEIEAFFPGNEVYLAPLSLSVACHIGAGALAITITKKLDI